MYSIGKLDRDIYKCVSDDIVTDEVVITDNQIEHIKSKHPGDYELVSAHFTEIITEPDYIIGTEHPNTAVILKEVVHLGERFQVILRICTSDDSEGYKNSIITAHRIDKKRWNRYLRVKKILYKKQ